MMKKHVKTPTTVNDQLAAVRETKEAPRGLRVRSRIRAGEDQFDLNNVAYDLD